MCSGLRHAIIAASLLGFVPQAFGDKDKGDKGGDLPAPHSLISVSKTAFPFWKKKIEYDWSIEKTADVPTVVIKKGNTTKLGYKLVAKRSVASEKEVTGVEGEVCVSNAGRFPTYGLKITDQVQVRGDSGWDDVGELFEIHIDDEVSPGETRCFPYKETVSLHPKREYRGFAQAKIFHSQNNSSFAEAVEHFSLSTLKKMEKDKTATLHDFQSCPLGFTCSKPELSSELNDSTAVTLTIDVRNDSVKCGCTAALDNLATLVEKDSGEIRKASSRVTIYTKGRRGD